jgi:hypothetical protein
MTNYSERHSAGKSAENNLPNTSHSKLRIYLPSFILNLLRGEAYLNVETQL